VRLYRVHQRPKRLVDLRCVPRRVLYTGPVRLLRASAHRFPEN
jgi:hypothetical protein